MAKESIPDQPIQGFDLMDTVFEAEDHVFKSGFVGLFTNSTKSAYFDKFFIEPIDCVNKMEKLGDL